MLLQHIYVPYTRFVLHICNVCLLYCAHAMTNLKIQVSRSYAAHILHLHSARILSFITRKIGSYTQLTAYCSNYILAYILYENINVINKKCLCNVHIKIFSITQFYKIREKCDIQSLIGLDDER